MKSLHHKVLCIGMFILSISLCAQNYKADRLKDAVDALKLTIAFDSLMPDTTVSLLAKNGTAISVRTDPMGSIEHVGIPLFNVMLRQLQPSPVYDFLEYAVLNWKYKINPNQLYLSKIIFKKGDWNTLTSKMVYDCDCSIENRDDKLYIVTWKKDGKEIAVIGVPIDYELLNNDTRRNMEKTFVKGLGNYHISVAKSHRNDVNENDLSIYGTEGLFVKTGKFYLIELLNQNVYYKLLTVYEPADTLIGDKHGIKSVEKVLPVVVNDIDFPVESLANLLMCDDNSVPDVTMDLDFHLSNYHRENVEVPLSQLKAFCRQQGCNMYFACDGIQGDNVHGIMFASNLAKGYNHLFSLNIPTSMITSSTPNVKADVYLYIPPIDKEKLLGTVPTKKSGVKFKLP